MYVCMFVDVCRNVCMHVYMQVGWVKTLTRSGQAWKQIVQFSTCWWEIGRFESAVQRWVLLLWCWLWCCQFHHVHHIHPTKHTNGVQTQSVHFDVWPHSFNRTKRNRLCYPRMYPEIYALPFPKRFSFFGAISQVSSVDVKLDQHIHTYIYSSWAVWHNSWTCNNTCI